MKTLPKGKFLLREGGLTVLQLEGSPSEIGLQHGASLREEIHLIRSKFIAYLSRKNGQYLACPLVPRSGRRAGFYIGF